jgi:hypothetical protein
MIARRQQPPGPDRAVSVSAPDERTAAERQRIREIVDRWFPLADWQKDKLSLLLNPGGRHA